MRLANHQKGLLAPQNRFGSFRRLHHQEGGASIGMHMEQGIGRTGYLLLAFVLFALGAFGLVLGTIAFMEGLRLFYALGVGTTGVALLSLYVFASFRPLGTPQPRRARPSKTVATPAAPEPVPAPTAPEPTQVPARSEEFNYDKYQPAPPAAPMDLVLPQAFRDQVPPTPGQQVVAFQVASAPQAAISQPAPSTGSKEWPQRRRPVPKPGEAPAPTQAPSVRPELTERYTRATPMVRSMLGADSTDPKPEEHVAQRAPSAMNTDFVPEGMSVGRCGQCKTLLLAPQARPIRLKCPDCAKVTLLE